MFLSYAHVIAIKDTEWFSLEIIDPPSPDGMMPNLIFKVWILTGTDMTRLAKYIADSGYCSRRAASRLIEAGAVQLNDRMAQHIDRVRSNDRVLVQGQYIQQSDHFHYYLYNKPVGVECVCETDNPDSIVHQLDLPVRVFPVGRLDKDSHGLLLLTNHGQLCQRLLHPDYDHEKEYRVTVHKPLTDSFYQGMSTGVSYRNVTTRPCTLQPLSSHEFLITLTQGMNRQIRRMCQALGYRVVHLQRLRITSLQLDDLPLNETRPLSDSEVLQLRQATGMPSNH